jgi:hypothetical protein
MPIRTQLTPHSPRGRAKSSSLTHSSPNTQTYRHSILTRTNQKPYTLQPFEPESDIVSIESGPPSPPRPEFFETPMKIHTPSPVKQKRMKFVSSNRQAAPWSRGHHMRPHSSRIASSPSTSTRPFTPLSSSRIDSFSPPPSLTRSSTSQAEPTSPKSPAFSLTSPLSSYIPAIPNPIEVVADRVQERYFPTMPIGVQGQKFLEQVDTALDAKDTERANRKAIKHSRPTGFFTRKDSSSSHEDFIDDEDRVLFVRDRLRS